MKKRITSSDVYESKTTVTRLANNAGLDINKFLSECEKDTEGVSMFLSHDDIDTLMRARDVLLSFRDNY